MSLPKYKVKVTLTFSCIWYFHHNDLMKIKDSVTRLYAGKIEKVMNLLPSMQFMNYEYQITEGKD